MRLALEIIGGLLISILALVAWAQANQDHAPLLPHYNFYHNAKNGYFTVSGTWTLEDEKPAWPTQTTRMECEKNQRVS